MNVFPAQAGIQFCIEAKVLERALLRTELDPGLRRGDGVYYVNTCGVVFTAFW
jgi:hypothetical protein